MSARDTWPGLLLSLAAAMAATLVQRAVPALSPLLVAIVLGVLAANLLRLPESLAPGLAVAAKHLLRAGIVLLGLQVVLPDIRALGLGMVCVVVAIVGLGLGGTLLLGRRLGIPTRQRLLIACGFSICGAAAVAAVEGVVDAEEEEVASAITLVVLFGTLMIGLGPAIVRLLDLSLMEQGLVVGGAIHEVAQVVAAGGILGGAALTAAVTVKLARVALLAPVIVAISARTRGYTHGDTQTARPPLVPLFVIGFLLAAVLRTVVPLSNQVLAAGRMTQTLLLGAAMFALGTTVRMSVLRTLGGRPLILGAISTGGIFLLSLTGVLLVH